MYALELSRRYGGDLNLYLEGIDRLLMFLGRYGRQDATALEEVPTVRLLGWADQLHKMIEEETRSAEEARKR